MSPMSDATISVQAGRIFVDQDTVENGMTEDSALVVEMGITNTGRVPYTLSAASLSCLMELSPDAPNETRSLAPAGGGEGDYPMDAALDDLHLGTTTIAPGQSKSYWVLFRGYRYAGSDVPRKITITLPDARGRRVQLVIADPARGTLRWEVKPQARTLVYGLQNTSLFGPELDGIGVAAELGSVTRSGPVLWDVGLTSRLFVVQHGSLTSPTSSFSGSGVAGHVTWPIAGWGSWQQPRQFGLFAGGEAQVLMAVQSRESAAMMPKAVLHGGLAAEGGIEFDIGDRHPHASPFPITFTTLSVPRWSFRLGYTHWWTGGGDSNGYVTSFRLAW